MTQRPENWDTIKAAPFGNLKLEPGGYILKVVHAGDVITPKKKHEAIKIYFDIAEGECQDFFKKLSENMKRDISLNYLQQTKEEESLPYFKRLIQFFEESNRNFTWDFRPMSLVGKLIGGVLGEREYLTPDNKIKVINDISYFCPISTIIEGGYNIPAKKKIDLSFPPDETSTSNNDYSSFYK